MIDKNNLRIDRTGENNPFFGRTHTKETRAKMSMALTGRTLSEAHKAKISAIHTGRIHTEITKAKISAANTNKNNPNYGKTTTSEIRAKISESLAGRILSEQHKTKISLAKIGNTFTEEHKAKISAANTGKNNPHWQNGISFEPYCFRFNFQLKEQIRNRDNRICVLCGTGEIQNGQRLSVHHIDADKTQGCNGTKWYLCALCRSCNSKPDTVEKEFLIVSNLRFFER